MGERLKKAMEDPGFAKEVDEYAASIVEKAVKEMETSLSGREKAVKEKENSLVARERVIKKSETAISSGGKDVFPKVPTKPECYEKYNKKASDVGALCRSCWWAQACKGKIPEEELLKKRK